MIDTDFAVNDTEDGFSPEEQAAWDAMRSGEAAPEPQAAAEPAPAAEPAAAEPAAPGEVVDPDAEDADDPEKNRGRFVRHGAFHKEREARKAAQRQLVELQEKFTRGDERLRLLTEAARAQPAAAAQPAAEPPAVPDPNEDVFGYIQHLKAELDALKGNVTQETERQRQEREFTTVRNDYVADLNRFGAQEPAFADAFRFIAQTRAAELKALGHADAQIPQLLGKEELDIAVAARQRGVSPAELLFQVAKARGFAPKAPEPTPAPATPAETTAEKPARVEAGQKGPGLSLSAAGGSSAGEVTAEMLANMSDDEFAAFQKNNGRKLRQLMGAG